MPDPSIIDPNDPSQVTQTVNTPNLELFNPPPNNWSIVGDVLARRRGLIPSLVGGFLSDYGARRSAAKEIPAFVELLKSEGSPLDPDQLRQINQMDPQTALQELSILQTKALARKAKPSPPGLFYDENAKAGVNPWEYLDKTEGPLPKGVVPYEIAKERMAKKDAETAEKAKGPKSYFQAVAGSMDPNNPNAEQDRQIADAWRQRQNEDNQLRASADARLRALATNAVLMQQPLSRIPGQSGFIPIDKKTGKPLYGLTGGEFFKGINEGRYGRARQGDLPTIAGLKEINNTLNTLTDITNTVLPPGTSSTFQNVLTTQANAIKLRWHAAGGDVNAKQYLNMAGTGLALQVQKLLTGSTRPVNLTEFQRVTGMSAKGDGAFGGLTDAQVKALVPTPYDTREQAMAKIKFLHDTGASRMEELSGYQPPENPLLERMSDPLASPDTTGTGPDEGGSDDETGY